jgi:hypothetical protein
MHQLWVCRECTRDHERYEIHDGHSTKRRTPARRLLSAWRTLALVKTDAHRDEFGLTVRGISAENGAGRRSG